MDGVIGALGSTSAGTGLEPSPPNRTDGGLAAAMGRDDFLQLLVAQLRHQDPLNPSAPEEFAAQLAQYSSLEQLLNIRETLDAQAEIHEATLTQLHHTQATQLIGQEVLAVSDQVRLVPGGDPTEIVAMIEPPGGYATLRLRDAEGKVVSTQTLGAMEGGKHPVTIDGAAAGPEGGTFTVEVSVETEGGESKLAQTLTYNLIEGVRFGPQGPRLVSGSQEIALADVLEVLGPPPAEADDDPTTPEGDNQP